MKTLIILCLGPAVASAMLCLHLAEKASGQIVSRLADTFSLPAEVRRLMHRLPMALLPIMVANLLAVSTSGVGMPAAISTTATLLVAALVSCSGR